jgi:hypothetical protein
MPSNAIWTAPPPNSLNPAGLRGDDRFSSIARLKAAGYLELVKIRAQIKAAYFAGPCKAAMPEE